MKGEFKPPLDVKGLESVRTFSGRVMKRISRWEICDGKPLLTLCGDMAEEYVLDLEEKVQSLGFLVVADIVAALENAASKDQMVATLYVYATRALWRNFKHNVQIQEPRRFE
jgi:hypothetical protein